MINFLNTAQTDAISLNAVIPKTVEISVDMLVSLQRFAWFGRFILIVLLGALGIAALVTLIRFIANKAVQDGCGKCNRQRIREIAKRAIKDECSYGFITDAIDEEISKACEFGIVYKAINKEINDSCRFGDIYMLAKHGEVPKEPEDDDTDDIAWLDDELSETDDDDSLSEV
jgi:hypothetical protein